MDIYETQEEGLDRIKELLTSLEALTQEITNSMIVDIPYTEEDLRYIQSLECESSEDSQTFYILLPTNTDKQDDNTSTQLAFSQQEPKETEGDPEGTEELGGDNPGPLSELESPSPPHTKYSDPIERFSARKQLGRRGQSFRSLRKALLQR